jgi:hypothetical protein
MVTDVQDVTDQSKGTERESEGAFSPTNSPCNRMFKNRLKAGGVGAGEHEEQIPYVRDRFERRSAGRNECSPAQWRSANGSRIQDRCAFPQTHRFSGGKESPEALKNPFKGFSTRIHTSIPFSQGIALPSFHTGQRRLHG